MTAEKRAKFLDVVKRARTDKGFKKKLLQNPAAVLKKEGLTIPAGVNVKFLEQTKETHYYVLPPEGAVLSDEELLKVVGGVYGGGTIPKKPDNTIRGK